MFKLPHYAASMSFVNRFNAALRAAKIVDIDCFLLPAVMNQSDSQQSPFYAFARLWNATLPPRAGSQKVF